MTVKQVVVSPRVPRKTLVVCIDEGILDPENGRHYQRGASNIVRLHDAILRDDIEQVSIYLPGRSASECATDSFQATAIVELCGEAHAALVSAWNPGDQLIFVGAGRGACVCIELARLLEKHGIPDRATIWKDSAGRVSYMQYNECVYKKDGAVKADANISVDLLVAFDPLAEISTSIFSPATSNGTFRLVSSTATPSNVKRLISFLAIDDHRRFFEPLVLDKSNVATELWVPGMHEAVVGSGRERLIADIPLALAVRLLQEKGVKFYPPALEEISENKDGAGVLSCEDQGQSVRRDRNIYSNQGSAGKSGKPTPVVHVSAIARMKRQKDYQPTSLHALNGDYLASDNLP